MDSTSQAVTDAREQAVPMILLQEFNWPLSFTVSSVIAETSDVILKFGLYNCKREMLRN